ncbi:unnamed protein product [Rhizophagus irregularis]|nr:unnamed protein product [Rhizophagus irregularis]
MTNEVHELTPTKQIKKPSCGILVGTEDYEIFGYDNLIIDEDKENFNGNDGDNELLGEEEDGEDDYNNWDEF